jgi:hypothetical protein
LLTAILAIVTALVSAPLRHNAEAVITGFSMTKG